MALRPYPSLPNRVLPKNRDSLLQKLGLPNPPYSNPVSKIRFIQIGFAKSALFKPALQNPPLPNPAFLNSPSLKSGFPNPAWEIHLNKKTLTSTPLPLNS
jgi:hypothetical protein